jgi:hypothetical protein
MKASKLKNLLKELYEKKPIFSYLSSNALDSISTYLNAGKYGIECETNKLVREIFYSYGLENGAFLAFFITSVGGITIPYFFGKGGSFFLKKILKKNIDFTQPIYTSLLYGLSAGKFIAVLNNFGIYFSSFSLPYGLDILTEAGATSLLLFPKVYKKLKEQTQIISQKES